VGDVPQPLAIPSFTNYDGSRIVRRKDETSICLEEAVNVCQALQSGLVWKDVVDPIESKNHGVECAILKPSEV
jgi:hypothetical protein